MSCHVCTQWRAVVGLGGVLVVASSWSQDGSAAPPAASASLLTTVQEVRRLSPAEAAGGRPVRLTGVVTYYDADCGRLFVQDATGGVSIIPPQNPLPIEFSQRVEIDGQSAPGDFAPSVIATSVRSLGPAQLPRPRRSTAAALVTGRRDSLWVELQGIVRTVGVEQGHLVLGLATDETRLDVLIPPPAELAPAERLVDAKVRLTGVCATVVNRQRQPLGARLLTPSLAQVEILQAAPPDPYAVPARSIGSLLQFSTEGDAGHRVKVRGVVTLLRGGRHLFVQDESGGVYAILAQSASAQPGDLVEVLGFPEAGDYTPILRDARLRQVGTASAPAPVTLTVAQALRGTNDAQVVQLEARLAEALRREDDFVFVLQEGHRIFEAHLRAGAQAPTLPRVEPGSLLRLTGVCSVQVNAQREPRSFRLLLRSPADLQVLEAPPWWRPGRAAGALAAVGAFAALALAWVLLLRRRVRQQTALLRQKLEAEAALQRRFQELFEKSTDIVYVHDLAGKFTAFNPAGERLLGYTTAEILTRHVADVVAPECLERAREMTARKLNGAPATVYELELLAKDGGRLTVEINSQPVVQDGRMVGVQGIARDITARRRVERQLEESLSLLHATLESTAEGILVSDCAGRIVRYNQKFARMWRLPAGASAPTQWEQVLQHASEQVAEPEAFLQQAKAMLEQWQAETFDVIQLKDGRVFERYSQPQRVGDRIVGRVCSFRDVTRRCQAEQALRDSEARFRALAETSPVGIWQTTPDGHTLYVNPAMCRLVEINAAEELAGKTYHDFYPPESVETLRQRQAGWLRGHSSSFEVEIVGQRGTRRHVVIHGAPVRGPNGSIESLIGVLVDITERQRAEHALRQSEELFSKAFNLAPTPIAITTMAEGRFLKVNEAFVQLYGYAREEVIGRTSLELGLWVDPPQRTRLVERLQAGESVRNVECQFRTRAGGVRTVLTSVEPIEQSGQRCLLFIGHDITERLLLEEQFRQAQKMEPMGRLAAGVAHDFNNLLTVIAGQASLLLCEPGHRPKTTEALNQIAQAAERAANLTRQLLAFSRRQVMQPRPLNLNRLVSNLSKMLGRLLGENITLHCHYSPAQPLVHADPGMIEQVLMNLAVNARDAMPKGGQLTLSTEIVTLNAASAPRHAGGRPGRFACLSVADTGCGIDAQTLPRIFEPFFTTKEAGKGTGLGLATVYGIVQQHQGWIEVASEAGRGATFKVFLPALAGDAPNSTADAQAAVVPSGRGTVLLAEDEPGVLQLAQTVLQRAGFKVLAAQNGPEARRVWEAHAQEIDLLLTDLVMPGGLSGKDLADLFLLQKPGLKLVFMSGYGADTLGAEFENRAGCAFLRKPYSAQELTRTVQQCLASAN